jgi:uncharacterized Zn-finger protein
MNIHKNAKYEEKKCKVCGMKCESFKEFKEHFKRTHQDKTKNFACNLCEKKLITNHNLRINNRLIHQDDQPFQCDHCALTFRLKNHLRKHLNEERKVCRNF